MYVIEIRRRKLKVQGNIFFSSFFLFSFFGPLSVLSICLDWRADDDGIIRMVMIWYECGYVLYSSIFL